MKPRYVIGKSFGEYTPESFKAHVQSLYKAPDTLPDSTSAHGIRLAWNKKGTMTVTCKRDVKALTEVEVTALASEYKQELVALTEALTKRGFIIKNQEGQQTNVKPKRTRAARKARTEADAFSGDFRARQTASQDQLFESGTSANVPQEGALQPEPGASK